jgi:hypothetical protein
VKRLEDALLRIIRRIGEDTRVESSVAPVAARNHDAMFISLHELVIKEDFPLCMHEFPVTMCHECISGSFHAKVLGREVLECVRKLHKR